MTLDLIRMTLILIVGVFLLSIAFNVLFKIGVILLLALGILYLIRKVFFD